MTALSFKTVKKQCFKRWEVGGRFKALHLVQAVLQARCVPLRACVLSHSSSVQLFATPWTVAHQAPLSMGFSRQEYWNELPFPPPGDLPYPGTEPACIEGRFFSA